MYATKKRMLSTRLWQYLLILLTVVCVLAFLVPHASDCRSVDCPVCMLLSTWQGLWLLLSLCPFFVPDAEKAMHLHTADENGTLPPKASPVRLKVKLSD